MRALIATTIIVTLLGSAASAANSDPISWGKPGVSYDQYRDDAKNCTLAGLDAELTQKPPPFWDSGSASTLDAFLEQNSGDNAALLRLRTTAAIAAIQLCLKRHGYHRFRLTDAQGDHLNTLAAGTEVRHQYLYSLGHDATILAAQAVSDDDH